MTYTEFAYLPNAEQDWILWTKGVVLKDRTSGEYTFTLYQVDSFYIEVKCHTALKLITGITSFDNTCELEPYLELIAVRTNY